MTTATRLAGIALEGWDGSTLFDRERRGTRWLPFTSESDAERRELWRRVEAWSEGKAR